MPFKKGQKKTGGRQKGRPNQKSLPLIEKAQELGIDPFEVLLLFAAGDWKRLGYESETFTKYGAGGVENELFTIQPSVRAKAAAEASEYLHPKRKAIDVTATLDPHQPVEVNVQWADDDNLSTEDASSDAPPEEDQ